MLAPFISKALWKGKGPTLTSSTNARLLATMAIVAMATTAQAQELKWSDAGFYVAGEVGRARIKMDSGGFNTEGAFPNTGDDKDRSNFFAIKGGVDFGKLRFDVSYRNYAESKFTTASFAPPTPTFFYDSKVKTKSWIASAYYDLFEYEKIVLYGGAGAGVSRVHVSANDGVVKGSGSDTKFAWQLEMGVEYPVTRELRVNGGFRHADFGKAKIGLQVIGAPGSAGDFTADQKANELFLGLRYSF